MNNSNKSKRYYWIKLKDSFFTSDTVDFLMSQKNGANYIVLYQMLCLKAVNTNGVLARQLGEIMVPFDVEKIQRDCKYFTLDTIRVALELYKKLGLIATEENGVIHITNFDNMIGSETQGAIEKREQRALKKQELLGIDKGIDNVYQDIDNKILDNKILDIDNKDIDKDINIDINVNKKEDKKEKEKEIKHKYGEFGRVRLTDTEYNKLVTEFGEEKLLNQIKLVDEYVESNNNKYKYSNYCIVIRNSIKNNWGSGKNKEEEKVVRKSNWGSPDYYDNGEF